MGGPFAAYSFSLPKPILHLLLILNCTSRAASLLLVFLSLRPPPPPPPSRARRPLFSHASDTLSSTAPPQTPSSMKSQLPVIEFQHLAGDSPSTACVVCLASVAATDEVRELGNCVTKDLLLGRSRPWTGELRGCIWDEHGKAKQERKLY